MTIRPHSDTVGISPSTGVGTGSRNSSESFSVEVVYARCSVGGNGLSISMSADMPG